MILMLDIINKTSNYRKKQYVMLIRGIKPITSLLLQSLYPFPNPT